jgi:hypothetical protein
VNRSSKRFLLRSDKIRAGPADTFIIGFGHYTSGRPVDVRWTLGLTAASRVRRSLLDPFGGCPCTYLNPFYHRVIRLAASVFKRYRTRRYSPAPKNSFDLTAWVT